MENISSKAQFLKNEYVAKLKTLDPETQASWGKMNVAQMIEHMAEYIRMAAGEPKMELLTNEEMLPKMRAFLESEKPFKENTPNQLLPDIPPPERHSQVANAITELEKEIQNLFAVFQKSPELKVVNPFFGALNYEQSIQLLHKHAWHHLKQFGIEA